MKIGLSNAFCRHSHGKRSRARWSRVACPRRNFCDSNKNCFDLRQKSTTLLQSERYRIYTYVETGIKDLGIFGVFTFGYWSFTGHYDLENGIAGLRFSFSFSSAFFSFHSSYNLSIIAWTQIIHIHVCDFGMRTKLTSRAHPKQTTRGFY